LGLHLSLQPWNDIGWGRLSRGVDWHHDTEPTAHTVGYVMLSVVVPVDLLIKVACFYKICIKKSFDLKGADLN